METTAIGEEYANLEREFGTTSDFEILSHANKVRAIHERRVEPTRILKFLDLGDRRNTMRAFSGSLRPTASGVQSYLNFFTSGPPTQD